MNPVFESPGVSQEIYTTNTLPLNSIIFRDAVGWFRFCYVTLCAKWKLEYER